MSENVTAPSSPAGGESPASPASAPQMPSQSPAASPQVSQAPAQSVPQQEDRSNWIPPYRLREAQEAATRRAQESFSQREAQIRAEADRYRSQLHQLVGVNQQPQNPETDAIRQQFAQLYPGLAKMEEKAAAMEALLSRAGDLESQNEHYWQSYGRSTVDTLFQKTSEAIGAPLTDEAKAFLHSSFVGYVQSSPERTERYASDPRIVDEFLRTFTSSIIDPSRRQSTAATMGRVPSNLPQDSAGGAPRVGSAPHPQNLDERSAMAWAQYQASQTKGGF